MTSKSPSEMESPRRFYKRPLVFYLFLGILLLISLLVNGWFMANRAAETPFFGTLEGNSFDITAPFDGELLALPVQSGEMLQKDQLVAQLSALSNMSNSDKSNSDKTSETIPVTTKPTVKATTAKMTTATTKAPVKTASPNDALRKEMLRITSEIANYSNKIKSLNSEVVALEASKKTINQERAKALADLNKTKKALDEKRDNVQVVKNQVANGTATRQQLQRAQQELKTARENYETALAQADSFKTTSDADLASINSQIDATSLKLQTAERNLASLQNSLVDLNNAMAKALAEPPATGQPATAAPIVENATTEDLVPTTVIPTTKESNSLNPALDPNSPGNLRTTKVAWVETLYYSVGDYVPKDAPIATLIDPQSLYMVVYIKESLLSQISLGDRVTLEVADARSDQDPTTSGTIVRISQKAMSSPASFFSFGPREQLVIPVKILVTPSPQFWPGMLLKVSFSE